jgi:hypothetical protein
MSIRRWVTAAVIAGLISAIAAGIGTYKANPSASAWAWGLYVGFLAATFIAVLWYALETQGMARTAVEQVQLNRRIFEAAHRPSIEVIVDPGQGRFYQNQGNYAFPFRLYNHGPVAAVFVGWQGRVRSNDVVEVEHPLSDAGRALFPTREAQFNFANATGPQFATPPTVEVEITVRYHAPSLPDVVYTTRMVATPMPAAPPLWRVTFPEIT